MGSEYLGSPDPNKQYEDRSGSSSPLAQDETTRRRYGGYQPAAQEQQRAQEPSYTEHSSQTYSTHASNPSLNQFGHNGQGGSAFPGPLPQGGQAYQQYQPPFGHGQYGQPSYPPAPPMQGYQGYQGYGHPYYPPIPPRAQGYNPAPQHPGQYFPAYGNHSNPAVPQGNGFYGQLPPQAHSYMQPGFYAYPPYAYGYPPPAPVWQPPRPKRDGYGLGIAIAAFICSILAGVTGAICLLLLALTTSFSTDATRTTPEARSAAAIVLSIFALAGLLGGGFGLYHSIRAWFLQKPSRRFSLPQFWVFLVPYVILLVLGFAVGTSDAVINNWPLLLLFMLLAGILPALMFYAIAVRRVHPRGAPWNTNWRRMTLALFSGATSAILLALILEGVLTLVASAELRTSQSILDNPNAPLQHDGNIILLSFIIVAVIAPIVEESVKPLAVVIFIGRMRNAAEAFILGMACGIGFDIVETVSYMSGNGTQSLNRWISTALERSTAGLLHGFGAGMVALGWYYLTHKASARKHIQLGLACIVYAILQHAIWNGSFLLVFLPDPVGPYLENGFIQIGSFRVEAFLIIYIVLSLLMFTFFLFVTGKLRRQSTTPLPEKRDANEGIKPTPAAVAQA